MKTHINPKSVFNSLQYGFSQAVSTGNGQRIVLSGQVGVDADEHTVADDLASQTLAAVDNIEKILTKANAKLKDVIIMRIYVVESQRNNQVCIKEMLLDRFPDDPPVTSWIFVSGLSRAEWLVEIEAEAFVSDSK